MNRVLYIGGYGRSGSTVLDTLLGNHPDILGAGELEMLFKDLHAGGGCTCGDPYDICPLWGKVLSDLDVSIGGLEANRLAPVLSAFESTTGRFARFSKRAADARLYGNVWSTVFDASFRHADTSIIVDSSKSSRASSRRILELKRRAKLDLVIVHLTRDPRAVLYSEWGRGNNDQIERGDHALFRIGGMLRPLIGWAMANFAVSFSRLRVPDVPVVRVRYEDLIDDPDIALRRIGQAAGVDLREVSRMVTDGELFEVGHGVRGNRMRRGGAVTFSPDTEWIDKTSSAGRRVSRMFNPIARLYGYDTRTWPASTKRTQGAETGS